MGNTRYELDKDFLRQEIQNTYLDFCIVKVSMPIVLLCTILISGHSIPSVNLAYMLQYVLKGDLFNFWESIEFFRLLPWFPSKFVPNA